MIRIITANLNGIRAAARKGFFDWMVKQEADIVCVQEIKAHLHQMEDPAFSPKGYHAYYFTAEKKGYSGVGIYCRKEPDQIITGLGWSTADEEGRYIQADFGSLSVASLYMPSGTMGEHRQKLKYDFMDRFMKVLKKFRQSKRSYIICGDYNIAHKKMDLKNWKANENHTGFLPEERAWMDQLFGSAGWIDAFREINHEPDQYTWWSNFGHAREKNVGWRLDYQVITPDLKSKVNKVSIYKDKFFSDHAPVIIDYSAI